MAAWTKWGKRPGIDSLLVSFPPPGNPVPFKQTDWPNPVLKTSFFATCLALSACIGTPNLLPLKSVTKERAAVSTKFEPRKVQQPDYIPNLLTSTLNQAVNETGFSQNDWPNPTLARKVQQPPDPPNLITSTLNQAVNQTAFNQNDWPNPTLARKVQQPFDPPNITGALQPPFGEGVAYYPSYLPRLRTVQPDSPPSFIALNIVVAANPFIPVDQPNPLIRKVQQIDPIPDLLTSTLNQAVNQPPFMNYDFPNPLIRKVLQIDPIPDLLTSTLNQAVNQTAFNQTNWPNPTLARKVQQPFDPPNTTGALLPPFSQHDWPNPIIRKVTQVDPIPDLLTSTLNQAVNHAAFFQTDQPNPVLRLRTVQPEPPPNILISFPVVVQSPFNLDDQPNPVLRPRTVQPEIPINNLPRTNVTRLRGVVATKIEPRRVQQPPDPPNTLPLKYFVPGQKPFHQDEWYTPRQRFDLLSQTLHVIAYGVGTPTAQPPFNLDDQPNPVLRKKVLQTDIPYNFTILNSPKVVPRGPYSIRVTKAPPQQPQLPSNILPLTAPVGNPKFQTEWPNPVLRVRTVQPEIPRNVLPLVTPPLPPFRQNDWLNPVRSKAGYWVFQFDRLNLALQPSSWTGINDSQTPGWIGTGEICTADSTLGTADTTLLTADLSCANSSWTPVPDSNTPAWVPIPDAQAPGWTPVSDANSPGWTKVDTAPGGTSSS